MLRLGWRGDLNGKQAFEYLAEGDGGVAIMLQEFVFNSLLEISVHGDSIVILISKPDGQCLAVICLFKHPLGVQQVGDELQLGVQLAVRLPNAGCKARNATALPEATRR